MPDTAGHRAPDRRFLIGLGRAFGGALFFAIPLLMTMEMWWLGDYLPPGRIALLTAVLFPVLVGLSHFSGFRDTDSWRQDIADALVAYVVGLVMGIVILWLFGLIQAGMAVDEIVGKVLLQAVPGSLGATLAHGQLGGDTGRARARQRQTSYGGALFLMAAGAIYFAFNVAPTQEMVVIAFKLSPLRTLLLALTTLLLMHGFVYAVEFRGQASRPHGASFREVFVEFTVTGYALCLLISAFLLWLIGRYHGTSLDFDIRAAVVLGFPAGLGAAAARLII